MTRPTPPYSENQVTVLGSCIVYLHTGVQTFKVLCQVTNTDECFLMGRQTAKLMGYVNYPQLKPPTKFSIQSDEAVVKAARVSLQSQPKPFGTRTTASINTYQCQADHSPSEGQNKIGMQTNVNFIKPLAKTVSEVTPVALQCRTISKHPQKPEVHWYNSKITLNGKEHSLPTKNEYMLKEYAAIFSGIGTLPGRPITLS